MKLRFRKNSLRLRLNRREVDGLAAGISLEECIYFPGNALIRYVLEASAQSSPRASFEDSTIRISAPQQMVRDWVENDVIGIYFELPANSTELRIAIEKDLECVQGLPEERDPDAFPRPSKNC